MILPCIIHKEGIPTIIITSIFVFLLALVIFYFSSFPLYIKICFFLFLTLFLGFITFFFRVPHRVTMQNPNAIIAPADGTIVQILEDVETEYFNDKRIQISIFMSPLNVHVNTYPIDGEVIYVKYHPGKHFVASLPKASKDNEHNTVVQKHKNGEDILFRQIAGTVARRIVSYSKEGDYAEQGGEMGIIKFGSRVDVFLPLSAKINVKLNDKVQSKLTHLAYIKE